MNHTQRWLARVRPRHNPAENALITNMRDDPHVPWLNSLAAMRHYARQRWPHDPGVNRSLQAYGSGIDAGTTLTRSDSRPGSSWRPADTPPTPIEPLTYFWVPCVGCPRLRESPPAE
jgi:hypothetical protein